MISAAGRMSQENHEFQVSLDYIVRPSQTIRREREREREREKQNKTEIPKL
jgi:hypothetical protein